MKAVILSAGIGKRLKKYTKIPKCLVKIGGVPLIHRYIRILKEYGVEDIIIVVGYKKELVVKELKKFKDSAHIKIVENPDYRKGSILSLAKALSYKIKEEVLIMDGDLYFDKALVERITSSRKKNLFLIDTKAKRDDEMVMVGFEHGRAVALDRGLKGSYDLSGEWAGFLRLSGPACRKLAKVARRYVKEGFCNTGYEFIVPELFKDTRLSYELIDGLAWTEIDFPKDVKKAGRLRVSKLI